jgi:RimJ/RimL family protein N-acetyltransferase
VNASLIAFAAERYSLSPHATHSRLEVHTNRCADGCISRSRLRSRRDQFKRVEIGSTWYAAATQRTALNTQCKRLLLGHAFETLGSIAVEFRTHRLNTQSRRAIERLGAQLDGILRAHTVMPNGSVRDTAVYSITAAEWPTVKAHLDWQLERPR